MQRGGALAAQALAQLADEGVVQGGKGCHAGVGGLGYCSMRGPMGRGEGAGAWLSFTGDRQAGGTELPLLSSPWPACNHNCCKVSQLAPGSRPPTRQQEHLVGADDHSHGFEVCHHGPVTNEQRAGCWSRHGRVDKHQISVPEATSRSLNIVCSGCTGGSSCFCKEGVRRAATHRMPRSDTSLCLSTSMRVGMPR